MRDAVGPVVLKTRPLTVEAWRVTEDDRRDIALWCGGVMINHGIGLYTDDAHDFATAEVGEWIIRGPFGEFYPAPDRVVAAKYEPVVAVHAE